MFCRFDLINRYYVKDDTNINLFIGNRIYINNVVENTYVF